MAGKDNYHKEIRHAHRNIQYYEKMVLFSKDPYQRMFYQNLLYRERIRLENLQRWAHEANNFDDQTNESITPNQREFTLEELSQYDGSGGGPAYVAVNGVVYDVSLEATWGGGTHFSLYAGKDLTAQFNGCHGGRPEVLRNLPQVGVVKG